MAATDKVIELRRLLAERFPRAQRRIEPSLRADTGWPTGIAALDEALEGGFPRGACTELVSKGPGSGCGMVLRCLIERVAVDGGYVVLIDGQDGLDLEGLDAAVLARLLWVRCRSAAEALKAADVVFRDPNFPLIIVDLSASPAVELRRVSASVWHRLARLRSQQGSTALVVTPGLGVGGAAVRVEFERSLGGEVLRTGVRELAERLTFRVSKSASFEGRAGRLAQAG